MFRSSRAGGQGEGEGGAGEEAEGDAGGGPQEEAGGAQATRESLTARQDFELAMNDSFYFRLFKLRSSASSKTRRGDVT